ncbi:MAG: DUF6396 domain-containing protein [Cystobacterineae bacterium]|nr:DUF6396 domain-containing protein [Cystobacterineae bacterium]
MKILKNISGRISALLLGWLLVLGNASAQELRKIDVPADVSKSPNNLQEQLPFTCIFEKSRPSKPHPDAEKLFQHAKWLHNKGRLNQAVRLYRMAAAWEHERAAQMLAEVLVEGLVEAPDNESLVVDLVEWLIRRNIPQGYYFMGRLLDGGHGVVWDRKTALQYFRRAADLGNPQAQYFMGKQLTGLEKEKAPLLHEMGEKMKQCAADQGHAKAAYEVALKLHQEKKHAHALKYFQKAAKAGNKYAAETLQEAFLAKPGEWSYMGLAKDEKRARRYGKIYGALSSYDNANLTVDDIDNIVPLPPAKLPGWGGQLAGLKYVKGKAPPLPSEKRIQEMAHTQGLDFKTGHSIQRMEAMAAQNAQPPKTAHSKAYTHNIGSPKIPVAASAAPSGLEKHFGIFKLPDLSSMPASLEEQLPFSCTHEKENMPPLPPPPSEAEMLYQHANWLYAQDELKKNKSLDEESEEEEEEKPKDEQKDSEKRMSEAQRLYRIAAAWGHEEAANKLMVLLEGEESNAFTHEHADALIQRGVPRGYYLKGYLLGNQDSKQNPVSLQYLRKAAELGNKEAQYALWSQLTDCQNPVVFNSNYISRISREMLQCAAEQGNARALYLEACCSKGEKSHAELLEYFQKAAKAGSQEAAKRLQKAFSGVDVSDEDYLGQERDEERAARYERISNFLPEHHPGHHSSPYWNRPSPTVDEMDSIVPLPPAILPAWDGHIAWVKKHKREAWLKKWSPAKAPALPSEKRIEEMARAKNLDFKTGLPKTPQLEEQPTFTCAFEEDRIPPNHPDAEKLFQRANWLYKKSLREKMSQKGFYEEEKTSGEFHEMERLYRVAAAWGHDKAANNLAHLLMDRSAFLKPVSSDFLSKPVELAEDLIRRGIPHGYRLMGVLLDKGHGLKKDSKAALQFFRQAADLGNPEAQYFLGNRLSEQKQPKIGKEMIHCAAAQGHVEALILLAQELIEEKKEDEALTYVQRAAQAGNTRAARYLKKFFLYAKVNAEGDADFNEEWYLAADGEGEDEKHGRRGKKKSPLQNRDEKNNEERSRRYEHLQNLFDSIPSEENIHHPYISRTINLNNYANDYIHIKVDDIDNIVPLPPAELPAWNEKLKGMQKWESNIPPPLPAMRRIEEMALLKGLHPQTGYPLKKDADGKVVDELSQIPGSLARQLPFVCTHEKSRIPQGETEADKLFRHAQELHRENLKTEERKPEISAKVDRLYRIAAAWGHEKAAEAVVYLLAENAGACAAALAEAVEISKQLIHRGIPRGYYLLGKLLEEGHNIEEDSKPPLQYFRRAADLGNPEAQYWVGNRLSNEKGRESHLLPHEVGHEMMRCAAAQGHAGAARHMAFLGNRESEEDERAYAYATEEEERAPKKDAGKLQYLQLAVRAGDAQMANLLHYLFMSSAPEEDEENHSLRERMHFSSPHEFQLRSLQKLRLPKDEERAARYKEMAKVLAVLNEYFHFNVTVDEIEQIVPLPPAKLPAWNGQLAWIEKWGKDKASPLSEKRIAEMARAKGLEPTTGRPMQKEAK